MFLWLLEKAGNGLSSAGETEEMLIVRRRREHLRKRSRQRWRGGWEDSREEDWLDEGISISRGFFSLSTAE